MSLYPVFLKLAGRHVLVVGGTYLAQSRIEKLLSSGAAIHVVAPRANEPILELASEGQVTWAQRDFEAADVQNQALVLAATGRREVDHAAFAECEKRGILCNVIDDPLHCHFYTPAVVNRGDLQIAISTNGQSPALAQQIRIELENRFDVSWKERTMQLGEMRRGVLAAVDPGPERTQILKQHAVKELEMRGAAR